MTPLKQTIHLHEEKKHSVLYKGDASSPQTVVTSIYIMKDDLEKPWPKTLLLTVEPKEG